MKMKIKNDKESIFLVLFPCVKWGKIYKMIRQLRNQSNLYWKIKQQQILNKKKMQKHWYKILYILKENEHKKLSLEEFVDGWEIISVTSSFCRNKWIC